MLIKHFLSRKSVCQHARSTAPADQFAPVRDDGTHFHLQDRIERMAQVHERLRVQGRRARGFKILAKIGPEVCFRLFPFLSTKTAMSWRWR